MEDEGPGPGNASPRYRCLAGMAHAREGDTRLTGGVWCRMLRLVLQVPPAATLYTRSLSLQSHQEEEGCEQVSQHPQSSRHSSHSDAIPKMHHIAQHLATQGLPL